MAQLREGLAGYDAQGHFVLELAQSYKISQDGKRYEFTLKPELKWSDGVPFKAGDFVFGIRRALSPSSGGRSADQFKVLQSVSEENGKIVFELKEANPYFLHILTLPAALPVREDRLRETQGKWSEEKAPGTGAFRFGAYEPGKHLLIERNPFYYGKPAKVGHVDFLFIQDESTGLNIFESGGLDIMTRVPVADVPRLRPTGMLRSDPYYATYFIGFNTKKAPFNNRDFRRAVSGAIHRQELVRGLATGEQPAHFWMPPGFWPSQPNEPTQGENSIYADSLTKVRAQLEKNPLSSVAASFDSGARNTQIMEKIQNDLLQELKLKISLTNLDWKTYVRSVQTDPTPIYRMGWQAAFADPMTFLNVFLSSSVNNYTGWKSPEYDQLVAEIRKMEPGPKRDEKIARTQKLLIEEDAVIAPIFHYVQNHLISKRVSGFQVNPYGIISFKDISL